VSLGFTIIICDISIVSILTVLNTLLTVIDDIIPFGSERRQISPRYYKFSNKKFYGWSEKI
jgi:hypothetical protein